MHVPTLVGDISVAIVRVGSSCEVVSQTVGVRSVGKFGSFEEIRNYPIRPELRVGDVAEVGYYRALRNWYSRVNGRPAAR